MGKAFTQEENKKNKERLKEEGRKLASQNGFKNTSIDELVKRCDIAKGQFYRYYKTKELFFLEVRNEVVKEIHAKIGLMSISWTQKVKLFYAVLLANNPHCSGVM